MKKSLLYTALGLMGLMGALAIGVVRAEAPRVTSYDSNITYTLNGDEEHLFTAGTITITDGETTITILDRNLGATAVGTGCEDSNWSNVCMNGIEDGTYGYHFQWGNNHGFAPNFNNNGSFPGNEKPKYYDVADVDASSYGPGNYYSGSTFIMDIDDDSQSNNGDWSTVRNDGLRGGSLTGSTDGAGGRVNVWSNEYLNGEGWKVTNATNRQGPCPKGFHVPSVGELAKLTKMFGLNNARSNDDEVSKAMHTGLNIPFAGFRSPYSVSVYDMGVQARLWSSSPGSYSDPYSRYLSLVNDDLAMYNLYRADGKSVRCFYDSYQPFTQSFTISFTGSEGGSISTGSIEVNSGGTISRDNGSGTVTISGAIVATGVADEGYAFSGWLTDCGNIVTTGCSFTGEFKLITYDIKYELDGGTNSQNNVTGYTIKDPVTFENPTKDNHTFEGRYTNANFTIVITSIPTGSTGNITLYAKWKKKSSNRSGGGSSGGGGSNKTGDTQDSSSTPQNNSSVSSGTDVKDIKGDTQDSSAEPQNDVTPLTGGDGEARGGYSQEFLNAYERAFKNGITTMNTIDKANMDGYIKRGHLAKMVVNYVTNVLGKEIPSDIPAECLSWTDTYRESYEIKDYATKSCALGLMGIRMKNNEFLPNDYVTRAEFGAVLSRILRGDKYNLVHTQEKPRYTDHLNALKEEGFMTKIDNPQMQEKRGYVMIMLMRSAKCK